jgi:FkbM family methyltransferase
VAAGIPPLVISTRKQNDRYTSCSHLLSRKAEPHLLTYCEVPPSATSRLGELLRTAIRYYIRSGARGSTRCTFFLAQRLKALQAVPVTVNHDQRLYLDLRDGLSHLLVAGSPWEQVPWDRNEQEVMGHLLRAGDVAYDIGAHIGLHSVFLSAAIGPQGALHAFEVNPAKIQALAETIRHLPNATLHQFGLAERQGSATLFVPEDQSMTSLADWTWGNGGLVGRAQGVLRTMDDIIARGEAAPPDFIKCDVEGAEPFVFKGGSRTLDRVDAPILFYEADGRSSRAFGNDIAEATRLLLSLPSPGYQIFWVRPGGALGRISLPGGSCQHFNLVAVPVSRMDRIASMPLVPVEL